MYDKEPSLHLLGILASVLCIFIHWLLFGSFFVTSIRQVDLPFYNKHLVHTLMFASYLHFVIKGLVKSNQMATNKQVAGYIGHKRIHWAFLCHIHNTETAQYANMHYINTVWTVLTHSQSVSVALAVDAKPPEALIGSVPRVAILHPVVCCRGDDKKHKGRKATKRGPAH